MGKEGPYKSPEIKLRRGVNTTVRFVAFLDIMGFKDRVARNPHDEILSSLTNLSSFISSIIDKNENIFYTMFSDSLMFYTLNDKLTTFKQLCKILNKVIIKSISLGIPIKGAIAKGEFTADIAKLLYFGQPLIDAYLLEESLLSYNIIIHHSLESICKKNDIKHLILDVNTPLRGGNSNHFILNTYGADLENNRKAIMNIRETVSDSPRRYIDNTLHLLPKKA